MYIIIFLVIMIAFVLSMKLSKTKKQNSKTELDKIIQESSKKTCVFNEPKEIKKINKNTCYLSYVSDSKIQNFPLEEKKQITIGSSPNCKVYLDSEFVDAIHAVIACDKEGWFLQAYKDNVFIHENKNKSQIALDETTYFTVGTTKIKFVKADNNTTKIYGI